MARGGAPGTGRRATKMADQLYDSEVHAWWRAGQYAFRAGVHELALVVPSPPAAVLAAAERQPLELALTATMPLVVLLCRLEGVVEWSATPIGIPRTPAKARELPARLAEQEQPLLRLELVEPAGGEVLATREAALETGFARILHDAIRIQAELHWGEEEFLERLDGLRLAFPQPKDLLAIALARCRLVD